MDLVWVWDHTFDLGEVVCTIPTVSELPMAWLDRPTPSPSVRAKVSLMGAHCQGEQVCLGTINKGPWAASE